jgi:23S rRNA-/tRNA-specific pseudouridylate synthase
VTKTYLALIWGKMRFRSGSIITPLVRSQRHRTRFEVFRGEEAGSAREAITEYAVALELDDISLIRLIPKTGRTHQLRVQMAHLKTPVLGDSIYGHGRKSELPRLALHAYAIAFDHPETGNRLTTVCPLPADMRQFISQKLLARKSPS